MAMYSMTGTCGHEMNVEADSREDGVKKMQDMMTQEALDQHMADYHKPGEPALSLTDAHTQIAAKLHEVQ